MPDQGAADNAALGFVARSGDWGWETWGSAAVNAAAVGLAGLADKCTDIAAAIRRQKEAGHGEDGA